jgi:hypothetical protein
MMTSSAHAREGLRVGAERGKPVILLYYLLNTVAPTDAPTIPMHLAAEDPDQEYHLLRYDHIKTQTEDSVVKAAESHAWTFVAPNVLDPHRDWFELNDQTVSKLTEHGVTDLMQSLNHSDVGAYLVYVRRKEYQEALNNSGGQCRLPQ